jgi:hypothetical protein
MDWSVKRVTGIPFGLFWSSITIYKNEKGGNTSLILEINWFTD